MMGKTILFVDDDQQLLEVLARRAQQLELTVRTARNPFTAMSLVENEKVDLVCADVNMPTGDGLGMCEFIAAKLHSRAIPLIVLTGINDEETLSRCNRLNARYVQKGPDAWQEIETVVCDLLQIPTSSSTGVRPQPPARATSPLESDSPLDTDVVDAVFALLGATQTWLDEVDAPPEDGTSDADWRASSPWVLLVEDDQDFSLALKLRLEQKGFGVVTAYEGRQGIHKAIMRLPAAIILDFNLPNGQGDHVLRRLKANPSTKGIPVFVVTGVRDQTLQQKMLSYGATNFFTKPLDFDRLYGELEQHLAAVAAGN